MPGGAAFCPKCGRAAAGPVSFQQGTQAPGTVVRGEKAEKHEKHEKREKREKGEKGERGGLLGAMMGGLILIWLGLTFFLDQNGYLAHDIWWAYFLLGVGAILILQGVVLYSRGRVGLGPLIGGSIIVFVGLDAIAAVQLNFSERFWPLIIVVLGVFVLVGGVASRRRVPKP
jgi:hypothetical protein